jgi:hypothetical protein
MAGKGGKGLLAAKTTAAKSADKDKKKAPVSRSSRAGLQVPFPVPNHTGRPACVVLTPSQISFSPCRSD